MKSILLTSTALVAFAGAAAAGGHTSISHALSGTLGYNSEIDGIGEDGFFWEGNLKTTAAAELDNGITAGAYFEVTVAGDDTIAGGDAGQPLASSDFVLSLTSDTASIYFGDTGTAAKKHWAAAGNMEQDGFTSGTSSNVLRGDVAFGGVDASISYVVDDFANTAEQLSFGASASFGAVSLALAYEEAPSAVFGAAEKLREGDFSVNEILGVSASGSFAGATVTLAYADNSTTGETSTGIKVAYPFGPVTATASYVSESNGDANVEVGVAYASGPVSIAAEWEDNGEAGTDITIEGSYDLGNGLTILAGAVNEDEVDFDIYVAGKYDLGGGASVTASYAVDDNGDQGDEIGAGEYDPGMTVSVSFSF